MVIALIGAAVAVLVISPWLAWLVVVGGEQRTQADLLFAGSSGLPGRIVSQALFYLQRIPDQITGPVVEVATVIRRTAGMERLANLWALVFSGVVIAGWLSRRDPPAAGWLDSHDDPRIALALALHGSGAVPHPTGSLSLDRSGRGDVRPVRWGK